MVMRPDAEKFTAIGCRRLQEGTGAGMRILVCVKQVPEAGEVLFHPGSYTLQRERAQMIPNPADAACLEIALRIREKCGAHVALLSMGPPGAGQMLRNLAAVGGDAFYLVSDPVFAGADTYATASILSRAIRYLGGFDLILCGDKSTDGETGQVGPELAAMLGYRFADSGEEILSGDRQGRKYGVQAEPVQGRSCTMQVELVQGRNCTMQIEQKQNRAPEFPLLASLRRSCVLRCPSLSGLRQASRTKVEILTAEMLGGKTESLTKVIRMTKKEIRRRKMVLCQDGKELIEYLQADTALMPLSGTGPKLSDGDQADAKSRPSPEELSQFCGRTAGGKVWKEHDSHFAAEKKTCGTGKKWMLIKPPGTPSETFEELRRLAGERIGAGELLEVICTENVAAEAKKGGMEKKGSATESEGCAARKEKRQVRFVRNELFMCQDVTMTGSILAEIIEEEAPEVILFAADTEGRQVAPWIAGKLGIGLTADLTDFRMDEEGKLHQFRAAYGASFQAEIVNCNGSITMATVKVKQVQASLVIAGGMGAGKKGFALLQELAELTGGALGATRAAVDAGLAPFSSQIGQSGICVRPKLYMAFGISGAIQHLVGMKESERIVAVNTDRKAAIFDYADYGICGDAAETAAELIRQILALRGSL